MEIWVWYISPSSLCPTGSSFLLFSLFSPLLAHYWCKHLILICIIWGIYRYTLLIIPAMHSSALKPHHYLVPGSLCSATGICLESCHGHFVEYLCFSLSFSGKFQPLFVFPSWAGSVRAWEAQSLAKGWCGVTLSTLHSLPEAPHHAVTWCHDDFLPLLFISLMHSQYP